MLRICFWRCERAAVFNYFFKACFSGAVASDFVSMPAALRLRVFSRQKPYPASYVEGRILCGQRRLQPSSVQAACGEGKGEGCSTLRWGCLGKADDSAVLLRSEHWLIGDPHCVQLWLEENPSMKQRSAWEQLRSLGNKDTGSSRLASTLCACLLCA